MNALDIAPHIAQAISLVCFVVVLCMISVVDWKHRRIPNKLLLALLVLRLSFACALGLDVDTIVCSFVLSFGCAGVMVLSKLLMDRISGKDSLGFGDIKLVAAGFAFTALDQAMLALFIACVSALLLAAYFRKARGDSTFPFGPPLCLGISLTLFLPGVISFLGLQ